ncbi:hypothetical protein HUB97_15455 [Halorubraceae archaeon YAN]|nr:hypothetical protein [Halorubraceae archaeon YAN]
MSEAQVIPIDHIATYLSCPRRYEYEHELSIQPDSVQQRDELAVSLAREAIIRGLTAGDDTEEMVAAARSHLRTTDSRTTKRSRKQQYLQEMRVRAIESYLQQFGTAHGDSIIDTDLTLRYGLSGVTLSCPIDALVRIGDKPVAIRYRWSLDSVAFANSYTTIDRHTSGRSYIPWAAGSVITATATIEALIHNDRFAFSETPGFAFVGLTEETTAGGDSNSSVPVVSAAVRRLDEHYQSEHRKALSVLDNTLTWITNRAFNPQDRIDQILDSECESCPYAEFCSEWINNEVMFR